MGAYKTSWKKAVFTVLFWIAYVTIGDICLMALLTAATGQGMTELMRDAGTYYLFCFCIKTAELLGIVILRAWLHSHVVNETLTLADLLRVIVFPAAMLAVSLFLIRFYIRVPELAAELAICNANPSCCRFRVGHFLRFIWSISRSFPMIMLSFVRT
jgi:hypothetical protein